MSTLDRRADLALIRDLSALGAAMTFVGLSYGAIAVAGGLPVWAIVAMSLLVFAGGAQFLAVGLVAAGNPVAAILEPPGQVARQRARMEGNAAVAHRRTAEVTVPTVLKAVRETLAQTKRATA